MMGSVSIDVSVEAFWESWQRFAPGKRHTPAFERFRYHLERNLRLLSDEVQAGSYRHGPYRTFTVSDPKTRLIAVASIRDRLIHRLLYDALVPRFDPVFLYDVWSCREGKGLHRAVDRAQAFLRSFPRSIVWRADIARFFESVEHRMLRRCIRRRISDERTWLLLDQVIDSYSLLPQSPTQPGMGIPIGNVTSQVFANIVLHELDRFVVHGLHPLRYLRYGDDFLLFFSDRAEAERCREVVRAFLRDELLLSVHVRNDIVVEARQGLRFCGYEIYPGGRRLKRATATRWKRRLAVGNIGSYAGLVRSERQEKFLREFHWRVLRWLEGGERGRQQQCFRPLPEDQEDEEK